MKGYIYKIEHKLTGKCYIGQTSRYLTKRIKEHLDPRSNSIFLKRALKKYGKYSFNITIVLVVESNNDQVLKDQLNIAEMATIQVYNSIAPNGYNMTSGGSGTVGTKGRVSPMKGKKRNPESTLKMIKSKLGMKYGPKTPEAVQKSADGHKKKIKCNETGQLWNSVAECAEFFKVKPKQISRVLKGQRKRLKWEFSFSYL